MKITKNALLYSYSFLFILPTLGFHENSFYDVSKIAPNKRVAKSQIVQFCFTSQLNIGDYLPTLGIWQMLGQQTDLWNMHDKKIDYEFINKNYTCAIIGGAGLFHKGFENFYKTFLKECKLPYIIWGVGVILPHGKVTWSEGVNKNVVAQLVKNADLVNIRDEFTVKYYTIKNCSVTGCPTIAYLQKFHNLINKDSDVVLYVSHDSLVPDDQNLKIKNSIKQNCPKYNIINHIFSNDKKRSEIDQILTDYCNCNLVVTTRLHGAIVAYSLGIPYIMLPFDPKLRAFHERFGNGIIANNLDELKQYLQNRSWINQKPIELDSVLKFGIVAKNWVHMHVRNKL